MEILTLLLALQGHARFEGTAMGSSLSIEVFGADQGACDRAVEAARAEIERLERIMTDWKPDSPLMDVNRAAGVKAVEVPPELFFIIERSVKIAELTDGAFDISFAGAGKLWNWRAKEPVVPSAEAVEASLRNVGWRGILLEEAKRSVFLSKPGMRIGLGAIGPGYAGDLAMAKIRALGIRDACVNLSGDVLLAGRKDGVPWNVAVTHPRKKGESLLMLPVSNAAVSTSGDYERYFEKDGTRYCHIIDPRTGYPAAGCQSVTIVAPNLAFADALATALFVLGPEKGLELVEKLEGVHAAIVDAAGELRMSSRLRK
jgi:thiamine biosynthesis lipoprotein